MPFGMGVNAWIILFLVVAALVLALAYFGNDLRK